MTGSVHHPVLRRALAATALLAAPASAQVIAKELPVEVRGMDVEERLGSLLPRDLAFDRADGRRVTLGDYFGAQGGSEPASAGGRPAILVMGYYRCPVVCPAITTKLVECLDGVDFTAGVDFNVLYFSFDHTERPADAAAARSTVLAAYDREHTPAVEAGWAFHTGDAAGNRALGEAVGYPYRLLPNGEYSHPVVLIFLSPEGKVTRYLYGYDYPPTQVKLALLDASDGKIARSLGERFLHFCYRYDPDAGRYTLVAMRVMQVGAAASVALVGSLVGGLLLVERVRRSGRRRLGSGV
ncbi:MAG: SCO family protein [Phycisphaerae bacterium]|nr:SCO family protein [Phycisphaerae bacterium]